MKICVKKSRNSGVKRAFAILLVVVSMAAVWPEGQPFAQQAPPPNSLDAVPDALPFNIPYGPPISASLAKHILDAAQAIATQRGWPSNIAIVDSGHNLVSFTRMDGAQTASIDVAIHKARAAVAFRRPTKVFEDAIQKSDLRYLSTIDGVIASRGGIPIVIDGKIVGGVGCSGGTGSQDELICASALSASTK